MQSPLSATQDDRLTSTLAAVETHAEALKTVWRPSLDDVERISRGDAAKERGVGSRAVPHRLNQEERKAYELAIKQGFLAVKGSGYRAERKGSPLVNIFRQRCDALGQPFVRINKFAAQDEVVVDLSPLRGLDDATYVEQCRGVAAQVGVANVKDTIQGAPDPVLLAGEPIWKMPSREVHMTCSRAESKALAQALVAAFGIKTEKKSAKKKDMAQWMAHADEVDMTPDSAKWMY